MIVFAAEPHDVFDAGTVVPAAVENHDLARCWKLFNITLPEHLRFLAIRGSRKRHHAKRALSTVGVTANRPRGRVVEIQAAAAASPANRRGRLHAAQQLRELPLECPQIPDLTLDRGQMRLDDLAHLRTDRASHSTVQCRPEGLEMMQRQPERAGAPNEQELLHSGDCVGRLTITSARLDSTCVRSG